MGAILLKPLENALLDGDHIYATIKSSDINHGGYTTGYTVPSIQAQADLVKRALEKSCIPTESISYIEAQGTGTSLGDPIEITGLFKAFGENIPPIIACMVVVSQLLMRLILTL